MASQNFPPFRWTAARERAAVLSAEDELSEADIAERAGVSRRALFAWRQHPDFQARVAEHVAAIQAAMMRLAIAKKERRVARLDRDWQRMQDLIAARGEEMADETAGGATGLLVRQVKVIGGGQHQQTVEEYVFDRALLAELRETEKAAAEELGQRVEKKDLHAHGDIRIVVEYGDDDDPAATAETAPGTAADRG